MSKRERGNTDLVHQKEELDILESIYMDEIEFHNPIPPYKFSVQCRPYMDFSLNEALEKFAVRLDIELSKNYPQESPKCEVKHQVDKITHTDLQQVQKLVKRTFDELKGSPMLFEIIESIRNWLQNNVVDPDLRPKKLKRKTLGDDLGIDSDFEDDEIVVNLTKKETYTSVTRESFLEWKKMFDEEMETIRRLKGETVSTKEEKLTGKQLFERNAALISSDLLTGEDDDVEEDDYVKEEKKADEEEEEDSERTRKLFYYNEELFEGDVDIDADDS